MRSRRSMLLARRDAIPVLGALREPLPSRCHFQKEPRRDLISRMLDQGQALRC
jgi:hypothetical protein